MSRPRRSFGANPPGRLAAAMLRALAAELSDPGRFSRAKAYARDGAVIDIEVEAGLVRGQVQGSRYDPYLTELHVAPAGGREGTIDLVPDRDEIAVACTCPDAAPIGGAFCKHSLATLLVLADEITVEPGVLSRWRARAVGDAMAQTTDRPRATVDLIAPLLVAPAPFPDLPELPPRLPMAMPPAAGEASAVLTDAIAVLRGL